ncbi:MAG: hypothetical protein C0504_12245 [Candidatus Solibacter sp.]|nr:hypothetical protein [Candidatus Solibacter sp.]
MFPDGTEWLHFFRAPDGYLLRFPGLAEFTVSHEGRVLAESALHGTTRATVEHLYLNQVLPLAWSRQGKLVFHGSAVEIGAGAAAFLGESGRGKSTIAAAFTAAGRRFLTDDGLRVELAGNKLFAYPSHPSIRLWEDSQEALLGGDIRFAPPVDYTSKARILAGESLRFCDEPRPLQRVYFLRDDGVEDAVTTPMSPGEALMELTKHSFLLDIEERELIANHFDRLARMVAQPVFRRLDYPRRYDELGMVRAAIERDLEAPV